MKNNNKFKFLKKSFKIIKIGVSVFLFIFGLCFSVFCIVTFFEEKNENYKTFDSMDLYNNDNELGWNEYSQIKEEIRSFNNNGYIYIFNIDKELMDKIPAEDTVTLCYDNYYIVVDSEYTILKRNGKEIKKIKTPINGEYYFELVKDESDSNSKYISISSIYKHVGEEELSARSENLYNYYYYIADIYNDIYITTYNEGGVNGGLVTVIFDANDGALKASYRGTVQPIFFNDTSIVGFYHIDEDENYFILGDSFGEISQQYQDVGNFNRTMIMLSEEETNNNKYIIVETYDLSSGVISNRKKGLFELSVGQKINLKYEDLKIIDETDNLIAKKNGYYGVIDVNENIIVDFRYSEIENISNTKNYKVCDDNYCGIINADGEFKLDLEYGFLDLQLSKGFIIGEKDEKLVIFNDSFENILRGTYEVGLLSKNKTVYGNPIYFYSLTKGQMLLDYILEFEDSMNQYSDKKVSSLFGEKIIINSYEDIAEEYIEE